MPTTKGGPASARSAGADADDSVRFRLAGELRDARLEAAEAAERFAELCRTGGPPGSLVRAAESAYLSAGRVLALANRFRSH